MNLFRISINQKIFLTDVHRKVSTAISEKKNTSLADSRR